MTLAVVVRLCALGAQFIALYVIVEYFDQQASTTFFSQLAVALVASRAGTLAFPLYAFALVNAGRGPLAIAMALQIQLVSLVLAAGVLTPLYLHWNMPIWSGLLLYAACLMDMNHVFLRHSMVSKGVQSIFIIIYEASQVVLFGLLLFALYLLQFVGLGSIIFAYTASMIGMMAIGALLSRSASDWRLAMRLAVETSRRRLKLLGLHGRRALPVCADQFIQMATGNFPVFAATIFGSPTDVISMALLQRLLSVVEAFSWLDVSRVLNLYYVEKAPKRRLHLTLAIALGLTALSLIAVLIADTAPIAYLANQLMPNIYQHLERIASVPGVFVLPALVFLHVHLHYIYLGAEKFNEQFFAGMAAVIVMLAGFAILHETGMLRQITVTSWAYALYVMVFIGLTLTFMQDALNVVSQKRSAQES